MQRAIQQSTGGVNFADGQFCPRLKSAATSDGQVELFVLQTEFES